MRPAALVVGVAALAWAAAAGAAPPQQVGLPSPAGQLTASPPLQAAAIASEFQVPGRISSRQRVLVSVGQDGAPLSVQCVQRLVLTGKGDYAFIIPAPVTDVVPAEGTESAPGFRLNSIVWQGFSPGRRVLAARATLKLGDSLPSLPVRVRLRTTVAGEQLSGRRRSGALDLRLTLANATGAHVTSFAAEGVPLELAGVLDSLRATIERGKPFGGYVATVRTQPKPSPFVAEALLEIQGVLRFPHGRLEGLTVSRGQVRGQSVQFSARLGDGDPLRFDLHVTGRAQGLGAPQLAFRVKPILRLRELRPPRGRTWKEAVQRGLVRTSGRDFLRLTIGAIYRASRVRQYEMFMANPDTFTSTAANGTVYDYRTAAVRATPAPLPMHAGGGSTLITVLAAVGGVLAASAALVLWSHS